MKERGPMGYSLVKEHFMTLREINYMQEDGSMDFEMVKELNMI